MQKLAESRKCTVEELELILEKEDEQKKRESEITAVEVERESELTMQRLRQHFLEESKSNNSKPIKQTVTNSIQKV